VNFAVGLAPFPKLGLGLAVALIALVWIGCEPAPPLLVVDGFSDLETPAELDVIELRVMDEDRVVAEREVDPVGLDLIEGARLAEIEGLPRGTVTLVAQGRRGGAPVGRFTTVVSIGDRSIGAVVWLTRACAEATSDCPRAGDASSETECVGGECVDPRCVQRDAPPEICDAPECEGSRDCPARGECLAGVCRLGRCLEHLDHGRCAGGECAAGGVCVGAPPGDAGTCPGTDEACNGLDDDCDTRVDEGFDTSSDPGGCGPSCEVCPSAPNGAPTCVDGACALECDEGFADCGAGPGCETSLLDPATCGGCDSVCEPPTGLCQERAGRYECVSSCPPGTTICGGSCVDVSMSLSHCGGCGDACDPPRATARCAAGDCEIVSCDPGWGDCDGDVATGCEQRLNTISDCGRCDTACAPPGATGDCSTGTCAIAACAGDRLDCNGGVMDGCECDPANATGRCAGTACEVEGCDLRFHDCDGAPGNGCEVDGRGFWDCASCASFPACGGPGVESYGCLDYSCVETCVTGYDDCVSGSGRCDTDTDTSVEHCGACGQSCAALLPADWEPRFDGCTDGTCTCGGAAACNSLQSCCEVRPGVVVCRNTDRNTDHCGACNTPCGTNETCSFTAGTRGQCCCGSRCAPAGTGAVCTTGVCNPDTRACE